jgi:hypothetical protein
MSDRIQSGLLPAVLWLTLCRKARSGKALGNDHDRAVVVLVVLYWALVGSCSRSNTADDHIKAPTDAVTQIPAR